MGKKRVHELAKEFGLENREVIQHLQAAGIAVKTHSSSVYEDEARAVLNKATNQKPEAPKPAKRPGMMIVRKRKNAAETAPSSTALPAEDGASPALDASDAVAAEAEAGEAPEIFEAPADSPIPEAAGPAPDQVAPTDSEASAPDEAPSEGTTDESAMATVAETTEPTDEAAEPTEAADGEGVLEVVASPEGETEQAETTKPKPRGKTATVVRMIDREKLLERVPQRRLGGGNAAAQQQKFGKVTELRVVTDPFGRGREMIDVGRDKKGKPGARAGRRGRAPTKREMMEMRERAMHPSRLRKKKTIKRVTKKTVVTQPKASKRVIKMKETIVIGDLAHQLGIKATEVVRKLMGLDLMVSINDAIDFETAQLVAQDYEYVVESVAFAEDEILEANVGDENPEDLKPRPPVVTVMGHVDHGKTSLLDYIRKSRVAKGEAGGITQHIGAYQVKVGKKGGLITFLDTPGHAAFTEMRARGAQVTDIVVLVVAADDGVMPQTEEAIHHAQAAGVPIVVAVNKIDKPEANPERVLQELTKFELVPEAWGGDTLVINTSATKGTGIKELLDAVLLQAEMLEIKANPERPALGVVVEAKLDKGRGPVATVLVQQGTLKRGDHVVIGEACGKVRAMSDAQSRNRKDAGPSAAVEVIGLDAVPDAGDVLNVVDNADAARDVVEHRRLQTRNQDVGSGPKMSLEDLMARMQSDEQLELKLVLKADVQGSVEAVRSAVIQLSTDEVKVNVIQSGVGGITESDIMLASASEGLVVGFGIRPDSKAKAVAGREGVEIRTYNVIYEMVDAIRKAMEGLLSPESKEMVVGHAEVREIFRVSKVGTVAGCRVVDGKAARSARVRVLRDSVPVYEGRVGSLRHFKDDAREVESGNECGVSVEGYNDIKTADVLEFFMVEEVARTLEQASKKRPGGGVEAHP